MATKTTDKIEYVVTAPNGLRLRDKPDGTPMIVSPHGCLVVGASGELSKWLKVTYGLRTGYVMTEYIKAVV